MSKKKEPKKKPEEDGGEAAPKKTSIVVQIVVFLLITAAAGGAGFGGSMFLKSTEAAMETATHDEGSEEAAAGEAEGEGHDEADGEAKEDGHGDGHGKEDGHEKPAGDKDHAGDKKDGEGIKHAYATPLAPILTNLATPSNLWIRIELAAVAKGKLPDELLEKIHQDLFAYMRTVKLHHIDGPSGFINLRAELTDRAATRSGGAVKKVLVRTLVIE